MPVRLTRNRLRYQRYAKSYFLLAEQGVS